MLDILHVTPEVVPFSKTGGLADVSAALPEALTRLGHRVAIVSPLYGSVDRERHGVRTTGRTFEVTLAGRTHEFNLFEARLPAGTPVYLLANDDLYGRPELYGTRDGDYGDNHVRFAFFCAAVFRLVRVLRLKPDVLHGHDWQAGLVPAYNRVHHLEMFATVLTVHNLGYQGLFPATVMPEVNLPWEIFKPEGVEFWGRLSFLKAGLVYANRVTTVSPGYAAEILTPDEGGGLHGVLQGRGRHFQGILNGADYGEWSPDTDKLLPANYSADDLAGKAACRKALLKEFGLPATGKGPLFGVVGRLATQKGFDLLADVLPDLVELGGRVVILGTGEREVEERLAAAARAHPGQVALRIAYDNALAHRIEAGSDFFLMPSRYEPCGLNQIYSMRYGTLPVVHATGGLEDTVDDVAEAPGRGTGIKFRTFTREAFVEALRRAADLYADRGGMKAAIARAMARDFSWEISAARYVELYESAVSDT